MADNTSKMKIALIAHDKKKDEIIELAKQYRDVLAQYELYATGTTGTLIMGETALPIHRMKSGPLGGDQQIGAMLAEGKIGLVIFLRDPLTAQPHDPDVKALLRIAQVYDIPIANTKATADFIITSQYMNTEYTHTLLDFKHNVEQRANTLDINI